MVKHFAPSVRMNLKQCSSVETDHNFTFPTATLFGNPNVSSTRTTACEQCTALTVPTLLELFKSKFGKSSTSQSTNSVL